MNKAVTAPASASTIQLLDDISDHVCSGVANKYMMYLLRSTHQTHLLQLCQVYDSAEFCRNVHASAEWRQQALQAVMITASKLHQCRMYEGPLLLCFQAFSFWAATPMQLLHDSICLCGACNAAVLTCHNSVSYMAFQTNMQLFQSLTSLTWVCRIHTGAEHASGALQCCCEVDAAL